MTITLNGNSHDIPQPCTVADLLESLGLSGKPVIVEHNRSALFPRDYKSAELSPGDVLEIITIAAGG